MPAGSNKQEKLQQKPTLSKCSLRRQKNFQTITLLFQTAQEKICGLTSTYSAKNKWEPRLLPLKGCNKASQHSHLGFVRESQTERQKSLPHHLYHHQPLQCQWRSHSSLDFTLTSKNEVSPAPCCRAIRVGLEESQDFQCCPIQCNQPQHSVIGNHVRSWNSRPHPI